MSRELVATLRIMAAQTIGVHLTPLEEAALKAADRIEALEADLERAEAMLKEAVEALEIIAAPCSVPVTPDWRAMYQRWRSICVKRVDVARAILARIMEAKP